MVEYFGIFFDKTESEKIAQNEKVHLEKLPNNFHCTFNYKPINLHLCNQVIGESIDVILTGYGCNGQNSGFEIVFPKEMKKYFLNIDQLGNLKVPHITTSISKESKAVDTAYLNFDKLENPVLLKGKFGYFIKEKDSSYISFEKINLDELVI